jgi:hypothetical protein
MAAPNKKQYQKPKEGSPNAGLPSSKKLSKIITHLAANYLSY